MFVQNFRLLTDVCPCKLTLLTPSSASLYVHRRRLSGWSVTSIFRLREIVYVATISVIERSVYVRVFTSFSGVNVSTRLSSDLFVNAKESLKTMSPIVNEMYCSVVRGIHVILPCFLGFTACMMRWASNLRKL